MSFNPSPGRTEYTASAGQTVFPFAFKIYENTDINVYQTLAGQDANDITDILILTTDYTVTINGDLGGEITLVSSAAINDSITIVRDLPVSRPTEYQTNGDLLASTLNQDQDYQTYLISDQADKNALHITLQESTQSVSNTLPAPDATKLLGWNSLASGLQNYTVGADDIFINILNVDSIADLLLVSPTIYSTVNVRGYATANDGGGGVFNYDSAQSAVNNGGTIINGWVRQYSGSLNIKWFGAKGDGTNDDTTAIQNAIDLIESGAKGGSIFIPKGDYKITTSLAVLGQSIKIYGEAASTEYGLSNNNATSRIVWGAIADTPNTYMINVGDLTQGTAVTRRIMFQDIALDGNDLCSGIKSTWSPEMIINRVSFNQLYTCHLCDSSGGFGRNYSNSWESCYFHNFKTMALNLIDDCHRAKIDKCHFTSTGTYIPVGCIDVGFVGYSTNITIIGCDFEPFGDDGTLVKHWIDLRRVRAANIISNYFEVPAGTSITSAIRLGNNDFAYGNSIIGNRFVIPTDAPDYGTGKWPIQLESIRGLSVFSNYFDNYNTDLLHVAGASDVRNIIFGGNFYDAATTVIGSAYYADIFEDNTNRVLNTDFVIGYNGSDTELKATIAAPLVLRNSSDAGVQVGPGVPTVATSNAAFRPTSDNLQRLGSSTLRWSEVFAGNAVINTSDDREKTYLAIDALERQVAIELKTLMKKFKFNSAIDNKGIDGARVHFGASAQTVKATFEKYGLIAESYSMLCYDEWPEEVDAEGNVIQTAGNRYGLRYEELLSFIISAM